MERQTRSSTELAVRSGSCPGGRAESPLVARNRSRSGVPTGRAPRGGCGIRRIRPRRPPRGPRRHPVEDPVQGLGSGPRGNPAWARYTPLTVAAAIGPRSRSSRIRSYRGPGPHSRAPRREGRAASRRSDVPSRDFPGSGTHSSGARGEGEEKEGVRDRARSAVGGGPVDVVPESDESSAGPGLEPPNDLLRRPPVPVRIAENDRAFRALPARSSRTGGDAGPALRAPSGAVGLVRAQARTSAGDLPALGADTTGSSVRSGEMRGAGVSARRPLEPADPLNRRMP